MRSRRPLVLVVMVLAAAGLLGWAFRTPLLVRWWTHELRSTDPNTRAKARSELLAIGRPAIDGVFPDLLAEEVEEELLGQGTVAFVGKRRDAPAGSVPAGAAHARAWDVTEVLAGPVKTKEPLVAWGPLVCPTSETLWRDAGSSATELVVVARRLDLTWDVRLAVPLGAGDEPVLRAVRERVGKR